MVLEDEHLAAELAESAYRKVQEYDWKERCKKILNCLGDDK